MYCSYYLETQRNRTWQNRKRRSLEDDEEEGERENDEEEEVEMEDEDEGEVDGVVKQEAQNKRRTK